MNIILKIMKLYLRNHRGKTIIIKDSQWYEFFYNLKKRRPKLLKDVYFNDDEDFLFSREIEKAILNLIDLCYIIPIIDKNHTYLINI